MLRRFTEEKKRSDFSLNRGKVTNPARGQLNSEN